MFRINPKTSPQNDRSLSYPVFSSVTAVGFVFIAKIVLDAVFFIGDAKDISQVISFLDSRNHPEKSPRAVPHDPMRSPIREDGPQVQTMELRVVPLPWSFCFSFAFRSVLRRVHSSAVSFEVGMSMLRLNLVTLGRHLLGAFSVKRVCQSIPANSVYWGAKADGY